ncbi:MAG TPA: hypothetical protein VMG38_07175 [Trebonia sp.]|nr:hypothetical protein [Trebonia sp.]
MSRHLGSLPNSSPTSVIVEFHEFDGRWFVTGRWGQGSGTEVRRGVRKSALGKLVLDRVEAARQEWRWRSSGGLARDAELWAQFCTEQAGVPIDRYRPQKRIVVLAGQVGMRWHDGSQLPPSWEPLPGGSPRKLGKALIWHMDSVTAPS